MVKIIDFIFPIAPLPKDKEELNTVIEGYESCIETSTKNSFRFFSTFILRLYPFCYVCNCSGAEL